MHALVIVGLMAMLTAEQPLRYDLAPVDAVSLAAQVAGIDDGVVLFTYPAREGVCGDGRSIRIEQDGQHVFFAGHWDDEEDAPCDEGPVRVRLGVRDGEVRRVDVRVAGRPWSDHRDGTVDLGEIPPCSAASYLLELARTARPAVGEDALLPAVLARGCTVWPGLLDLARDRGLDEDVRRSALFWVGQAAGDQVTQDLVAILDDQDEVISIREAAIFALCESPADAYPVLERIALSSPHPQLRRNALFWLADSDDPRAVDLFESILLGAE